MLQIIDKLWTESSPIIAFKLARTGTVNFVIFCTSIKVKLELSVTPEDWFSPSHCGPEGHHNKTVIENLRIRNRLLLQNIGDRKGVFVFGVSTQFCIFPGFNLNMFRIQVLSI